jgi:hypothetical protein
MRRRITAAVPHRAGKPHSGRGTIPHVPDQHSIDLESVARDYLALQLGGRAPERLVPVATFSERPLAGEGPVTIFCFDLPAGTPGTPAFGGRDPRHYVVVGQTVPNYFPSYGLDADDAYSLHIGTRFMLEMQISRAEPTDEPPGARETLRKFVQGCNPRAAIGPDELMMLFRCEDRLFAVYRVAVVGRRLYCMGGDLPPGFYDLADHPPQVALRLHLGKLIREEARGDR